MSQPIPAWLLFVAPLATLVVGFLLGLHRRRPCDRCAMSGQEKDRKVIEKYRSGTTAEPSHGGE